MFLTFYTTALEFAENPTSAMGPKEILYNLYVSIAAELP